jgi:hypothetical protein
MSTNKYLTAALELDELLNAKMPNGSYVLKKENRLVVIKASILLRKIYEENYARRKNND